MRICVILSVCRRGPTYFKCPRSFYSFFSKCPQPPNPIFLLCYPLFFPLSPKIHTSSLHTSSLSLRKSSLHIRYVCYTQISLNFKASRYEIIYVFGLNSKWMAWFLYDSSLILVRCALFGVNLCISGNIGCNCRVENPMSNLWGILGVKQGFCGLLAMHYAFFMVSLLNFTMLNA